VSTEYGLPAIRSGYYYLTQPRRKTMPARDLTRWRQNDSGDWERNLEGAAADVDATEGALEAAAELGVDINAIEGSGKEGRVTKADVEAAAS
jgi:pyruvate/2-oxoglutarate dehydrogenase complex dihydrolipoamide acyltransferase (E2) component